MTGRKPLSIREVGHMFGFELPEPGRGRASRSRCPFRKHARKDPTFRVFLSRTDSKPLFKCWSCDEPDNVGDAVALYAKLAGIDRKAAWRKLLDDGYAVPGATDQEERRGHGGGPTAAERDRRDYAKAQQKTAYAIPVTGARPERILLLDKALKLDRSRWERWAARRSGQLERFAAFRGMDAPFLREHGVVEMGGPFVGFTYFEPDTVTPCRVKVRGIDQKRFWVEPRPPEGVTEFEPAIDVLYMANELLATNDLYPVIITEGELDALAVRYRGIMNVISLPDGAGSAETADLTPIMGRFAVWLVATDGDAEGDKAYKILRARGAAAGEVLRVKWQWMIGGELVTYKDANDALLAGFQQSDFLRCLMAPAEERRLEVAWRLTG